MIVVNACAPSNSTILFLTAGANYHPCVRLVAVSISLSSRVKFTLLAVAMELDMDVVQTIPQQNAMLMEAIVSFTLIHQTRHHPSLLVDVPGQDMVVVQTIQLQNMMI